VKNFNKKFVYAFCSIYSRSPGLGKKFKMKKAIFIKKIDFTKKTMPDSQQPLSGQ